MKRWGVFLALGMMTLSAGAEPEAKVGTVLKAENLNAEPTANSKQAATIERGEQVEILERQGGWLKVRARQVTGWLRYLSVKHGEMSKTNVDAGGVLSLVGGRAGSGEVVSVAGIRGISEEQLRSASFNEREYKKLESYGVSRESAAQFAIAGGLRARPMDYPEAAVTTASQPQGFPR